jgi:hypothetical protein
MICVRRIRRSTVFGPILNAALSLELPVFPCFPNKQPACPGGFNDAARDPDTIRTLFWRYPGPLIGVPTGETSDVDVLDIDSTKHPEAGAWIRQFEPIDTRAHRTRSGGRHELFRHEPGLRCQQSYPVAGIDIRADGGYIIWWPTNGFEVRDRPIVRWPQPLLTAVRRASVTTLQAPPPQSPGLSPYAATAIAGACKMILDAPDGGQRAALNRESFAMGTLVGAGGAPEGFVRYALRQVGRQMRGYDATRPWLEHQIDRIVEDAVTDGMRHPRGPRGDTA